MYLIFFHLHVDLYLITSSVKLNVFKLTGILTNDRIVVIWILSRVN